MTEQRDRNKATAIAFSELLFRTAVACLVITLAACSPGPSTTPPTASVPPSTPPSPAVLGVDWGRAPSVEGPRNFQETVSPSYLWNHPILRFPGQAVMSDVLGLPGDGAVAVGSVPPDWTPAAWSSSDGLTWELHLLGNTDFTFPVALASGGHGVVVAVGRSRNVPVAWTTQDGAAWTRHEVAVLSGGGTFERMTSVAAGPQGFVAGGSIGPEVGDRHARFWTSMDGLVWQPVPDDPVAFANAEVRSVTSLVGRFVAVGVLGSTQKPIGSVAWTSADGMHWTRHDSPAFDDGLAVAAAAAPFGGVVAVGSTIDRREAVSWVSSDGEDWTKAASQESRRFGNGYIWMTDVVAVDALVIAIGDYQPLQRATGTAWVSTDGMSWERAKDAPVLEQADLHAIASGGPGAIVVGDFGGPDSHVPTVWFSPGR